jgi:hypothetical protein
VKKGSKLDKDRELLELAQRYHRVVAERDAGKFLLYVKYDPKCLFLQQLNLHFKILVIC